MPYNGPRPSDNLGAAWHIRAALQGLPGPFRAVAAGESGVVIEDLGGRPLEVGIRVAGGLSRDVAAVRPFGRGEAHVHEEIPVVAVCDAGAGWLLGALVEAAAGVRR